MCGIVGKTRFKFDVWSNDVNFANKMESTGKPGQVHISEKTYKFLKDDYLVEEGEILNGKYIFILFPVFRDFCELKIGLEFSAFIWETSFDH